MSCFFLFAFFSLLLAGFKFFIDWLELAIHGKFGYEYLVYSFVSFFLSYMFKYVAAKIDREFSRLEKADYKPFLIFLLTPHEYFKEGLDEDEDEYGDSGNDLSDFDDD